MNIKNNRRRRASRDAIENIFIELLQTKSLNEISVSDICKKAGLNRSTFYAIIWISINWRIQYGKHWRIT